MSPAPRAAVGLAVLSVLALVLPPALVALAGVALLTATVVDALAARRPPEVRREVPTVMARGVPTALTIVSEPEHGGRLLIRQPVPPDLLLSGSFPAGAPTPASSPRRGPQPRPAPSAPSSPAGAPTPASSPRRGPQPRPVPSAPSSPAGKNGVYALEAVLTPRRRGRHLLPPPALRAVGPLGLGRWDHTAGDDTEVLVYPDLPAARRLVLAVRHGRFRDQGRLSRGPLGLGTDFELVRDYVPDDDVRQVNWRATARMDRPMSNQYRVDQDRDVVCLVDAGRLMAAPVGDRTRLDAALDAVVAVALVADEVGDRCGAIAFDTAVLRSVPPKRSGGSAVVRALFDLEPSSLDSDYEMAFHRVGRSKRAFVLVLTDLLDEAAARPLLEAMPVLARRHSVAVASVTDPDLTALVSQSPDTPLDVYAASVAVEVLDARAQVTAQLTRAGAQVLEAPPGLLGEACVGAYLRMKSLARL